VKVFILIHFLLKLVARLQVISVDGGSLACLASVLLLFNKFVFTVA